jgi:hypothetical protein
VKTTEGEIYEMYFDRGTNLKHPEFPEMVPDAAARALIQRSALQYSPF